MKAVFSIFSLDLSSLSVDVLLVIKEDFVLLSFVILGFGDMQKDGLVKEGWNFPNDYMVRAFSFLYIF